MPEEIDAHVSASLDAALDASGKSLRELSRESGIKLTRLGDVLRRGRAITVGELDAIADALDLVGWKIMRDAEEALREPLAEVRDLSELRARVESGQVGDVAALDPGYLPEDEQEPELP